MIIMTGKKDPWSIDIQHNFPRISHYITTTHLGLGRAKAQPEIWHADLCGYE